MSYPNQNGSGYPPRYVQNTQQYSNNQYPPPQPPTPQYQPQQYYNTQHPQFQYPQQQQQHAAYDYQPQQWSPNQQYAVNGYHQNQYQSPAQSQPRQTPNQQQQHPQQQQYIPHNQAYQQHTPQRQTSVQVQIPSLTPQSSKSPLPQPTRKVTPTYPTPQTSTFPPPHQASTPRTHSVPTPQLPKPPTPQHNHTPSQQTQPSTASPIQTISPSSLHAPVSRDQNAFVAPTAYINPSAMAPKPTPVTEPDKAQMLVALAEEYFESAHQLAPAVALSLNEHDIEQYDQLISTGLGCLAAALKKIKMSPRVEARVRLRYAGVLFEETENYMEAETALSHGISLCDRNRYFELKYAMQFLLARVLGQKSPKAAIKSLEGYATDAETCQHFPWVYAFRLLRASYSSHGSSHVDIHAAVQSYRSVSATAAKQQDYAVHMAASLLEAIALMRTTSTDAMQNVQSALAKAWTNQLNVGKATQLIGIAHFVQVACSIRQGNPGDMQHKLKDMQTMMDASLRENTWSTSDDSIALPLSRNSSSTLIVSEDTRAVLGIGEDGRDNLMLSFVGAKDAYAINYMLCGLVYFHRNAQDHKALRFFKEGLMILEGEPNESKISVGVLPQLMTQNLWRGQVKCYLHAYLAFLSAVSGDWSTTRQNILSLEDTAQRATVSLDGVLGALVQYLKGVLSQGTGDLNAAVDFFENGMFDLSRKSSANPTLSEKLQRDIAILAVLNKLSILQINTKRDSTLNSTILKALKPLCAEHPNTEISTAYHLLLATIKQNPDAKMFEIKTHLRHALNGAQATANTQFICITLNVMCSRFFTDNVGQQAEKSAQAALATATKLGNPLWKSVAEGMLGDCLTRQGRVAEGQEQLQAARRLSAVALPKFQN